MYRRYVLCIETVYQLYVSYRILVTILIPTSMVTSLIELFKVLEIHELLCTSIVMLVRNELI